MWALRLIGGLVLGRRRLRAAAWCACLLVAAGATGACGTETSSPAAGTFTPRVRGVLTVATTVVPSAGFWQGSASHPTGGL
jgi:hypothetical protein